jgi:hypothetical protein
MDQDSYLLPSNTEIRPTVRIPFPFPFHGFHIHPNIGLQLPKTQAITRRQPSTTLSLQENEQMTGLGKCGYDRKGGEMWAGINIGAIILSSKCKCAKQSALLISINIQLTMRFESLGA